MFASTLKIVNSARAIFTFFLVVISGLTVLLALPLAGKNKVLVVQSGSMNPTIPTGSIVIIAPSLNKNSFISPKEGLIKIPKYYQNDIVSYKQTKNFVTHRVIEVEKQEKGFLYLTKGDANKGADLTKVLENQISGKVILTIPFFGYLIGLAKSKYGIIALIFLPAAFVIVAEIINIAKELKKKSLGNLPKGTIYIIPFFLCLIFLASTKGLAYFNDQEASMGNKFQAAAPSLSPTLSLSPSISPSFSPVPSPAPSIVPIASHLVINEILYDTSSSQNISGQGGSNRGEWIEIYNPTSSSVNVNSWVIEDNTSSETLPNITIPSGGFLILTGATAAEFQAIWSAPVATQFAQASGGTIGNGFANDGDLARLKDSLSNIIDQISWGNDTSVLNPSPPDVATGHSLERNPAGIDTDTFSDFVDRLTPAPGL